MQRQAALLKQSGDALAAEKLLRREVARVASRRDDLQQDLVLAQANQLLEQGNAREGMEVIERILREQRSDGRGKKVYSLILEYKKFAIEPDFLLMQIDFSKRIIDKLPSFKGNGKVKT